MKKTHEVRTWKSMCGANHGGGEADDGGHQWLDQWPLMSGVMVCLCEREPKSERDEELSRRGELCENFGKMFYLCFNGKIFYTTFLWVFLWLKIFYRWLTILLWNKRSKMYKIIFWKYFTSQPSECKCIVFII